MTIEVMEEALVEKPPFVGLGARLEEMSDPSWDILWDNHRCQLEF